jgi:hypothetical protein
LDPSFENSQINCVCAFVSLIPAAGKFQPLIEDGGSRIENGRKMEDTGSKIEDGG